MVAAGCFCLLSLLRADCVLFGGIAIWYSWVEFLGCFSPLCYNIMGMFLVPVCCLFLWLNVSFLILVIERLTCVLLFLYPVLHHLRQFFLHCGFAFDLAWVLDVVCHCLSFTVFLTTVRPLGQLLLVYCLVGGVRWCPYYFLYTCCPCWRGMSYYCFEYWVFLYGESVI